MNTCTIHGDELIHEPGGDDMPTSHGRTYCPTCQERLMAALDAETRESAGESES